jgi:hypothetical protein
MFPGSYGQSISRRGPSILELATEPVLERDGRRIAKVAPGRRDIGSRLSRISGTGSRCSRSRRRPTNLSSNSTLQGTTLDRLDSLPYASTTPMTFLTLLTRSPQLARALPRYASEIGAETKVLAAAGLPRRSALALAARHRLTHRFVPSPHYVSELTLVAAAVIERRGQPGHVVELGAYKGSSTAKLSLACRLAGKRLWVFDSFEGLPEPVRLRRRRSHGINAPGGGSDLAVPCRRRSLVRPRCHRRHVASAAR